MTEPLQVENIFSLTAEAGDHEEIMTLLATPELALERIISNGQATPDGTWYDQDKTEWVVLLKGSAGLLFEGEDTVHTLAPGDAVLIPAHARHRVEWTDPDRPTVWLALHYKE